MKWWKRDVGAWRAKTGHMTPLEKGIYGELLDHYYATEDPLPLMLEELSRVAGATSSIEVRAVEKVTRMFEKTPDGYVNKRAEEEITKYLATGDRKKQSAIEGWKKRKAARSNVIPIADKK